MQITRTSILSGVKRTLDIDVTEEQLSRWKAGELIQNVMPNLSENDREFIKTGITAEEWEAMSDESEDEDEL